jgi:hypothetical protein
MKDQSDPKVLVPESFRLASDYMYGIEIALRELIIEVMDADPSHGRLWYLKLEPARDVVKKMREARTDQLRNRHIQFIAYHPIYYTDFPDLRKLFESRLVWPRFERYLWGKEAFLGDLEKLEPIRNSIAHHRPVPHSTVEIIAPVWNMLKNRLGEEKIKLWVQRPTVVENIREKLNHINQEIHKTWEVISQKECQLPDILEVRDCVAAWWFTREYLLPDKEEIPEFDSILKYFNKLSEYNQNIPFHERGYVIKIRKWVGENKIDELVTNAESVMVEALNGWG